MKEGRIWLIGGTQESSQLATAIVEAGFPCVVTVTTATAVGLYPVATDLQIQVGCLDGESLRQLLESEQIIAVLDASHPYAVQISQLAIAIASELQIPYLRYERPKINPLQSSQAYTSLHLDSFTTLLAGDYLQNQRVLLTIGYRPLSLFQSWHERSLLFARILPSLAAMEAAFQAGFSSDRLIAFRPPISESLEKALWQQWQISLVVTKASGTAGGEAIKQRVAAELGVTLVTIDRPNLFYPQQTSDLTTALEFCRLHCR